MPRKLHQMPSGPPDPLPGVQPLVNDPAIMHRIGLNMTREETNSFVQSLDRLYFGSLADSELPAPEGMWISDSPEITAAIENHIKNRRMADIRTKRRPIHQINPSDWKGIIPRGKSAILIDSSTNAIFAVVIRNTVGDTGLVKWMDGVAQQHTDIARNIRKDDMGTMALHSYTAGELSNPNFGWARNIITTRFAETFLRKHLHDLVSAHSIIWNIATRKLPANVIQDMRNAMANLPRSDWNMMGTDMASNLSAKSGDVDLEFEGLELGPPSGVCSSHYARYCHHERNHPLSPWVISLTTSRSCTPSPLSPTTFPTTSPATSSTSAGGTFYLARYGVAIEPECDTLVVHDAGCLHGTTLHLVDRETLRPGGEHRGWSMYVAKGLEKVWGKVRGGAEGMRGVEGGGVDGGRVGAGEDEKNVEEEKEKAEEEKEKIEEDAGKEEDEEKEEEEEEAVGMGQGEYSLSMEVDEIFRDQSKGGL